MPAIEEGVCHGEPGQRRHGLHPLAKRVRYLLARRQDRLQQVNPGLSRVWLPTQSAQFHAEALRCEPECCERRDASLSGAIAMRLRHDDCDAIAT